MPNRVILLSTIQPKRVKFFGQLAEVFQQPSAVQVSALWSAQLTIIIATSIEDTFKKLQVYGDELAIFCFDGRDKSFKDLCNFYDQQNLQFSSVLNMLPHLRLIDINRACQPKIADPLSQGKHAFIGTSKRLPTKKSDEFQLSFYTFLATGHPISHAFTKACTQAAIPPGKGKIFYTMLQGSPVAKAWELLDEFTDSVPVDDIAPASFPESIADDLLESIPFPAEPFPGLTPYSKQHAPVFWGRDIEVRNLLHVITDESCPSVILLHGQAGVGKTSLLQAGLIPRLQKEFPQWIVLHIEGGPGQRIFENLCGRIQANPYVHKSQELFKEYLDQQPGQVLLCVDSLDWQLRSSNFGDARDLQQFFRALKSYLACLDSAQTRKLKILLSVRNEFKQRLKDSEYIHGPEVFQYEITPLNAKAIRKIVNGVCHRVEYHDVYKLLTSNGLEIYIAFELLSHRRGSPVAPYLQLIMVGLWRYFQESDIEEDEILSVDDYQKMMRTTDIFDEFFRAQYQTLHRDFPLLVEAGFQNRILGHPKLNGQNQIVTQDLPTDFPAQGNSLPQVLARLQDLYLLVPSLEKEDHPIVYYSGHTLLAPYLYRNFYTDSHRFENLIYILAFARTLTQRIDLKFEQFSKKFDDLTRPQLEYVKFFWRWQLGVALVASLLLISIWAIRVYHHAIDLRAIFGDMSSAQLIVAERLENTESPSQQAAEWISRVDPLRLDEDVSLQTIAWLKLEQSLLFNEEKKQIDSLAFGNTSSDLFYVEHFGDVYQQHLSPLFFQTTELLTFTHLLPSAPYMLDGKQLIVGHSDGTTALWQLDEMKQNPLHLESHDTAIELVGSSPSQDAIFTIDAGRKINIYQILNEQAVPIYWSPLGPVRSAAIHSERSLLACATLENRIDVWRWPTGVLVQETVPLSAPISKLVFHPNGHQLLSATTTGEIAAWSIAANIDNIEPDDEWRAFAPQEATILTYSPNGAIIMASWGEESIRLWDAKSFQLLGSIESQHGPIQDIDFSPDGTLMAMATAGAIEFWDVAMPAQVSSEP